MLTIKRKQRLTDFVFATIMAVLIATALMVCTSCENNVASDLGTDKYIVLQGYLYQGEQVTTISLKKTLSIDSEDTIYPPITDAQVTISWNGSKYALTPTDSGYYRYDGTDLKVIAGDTYSIEVKSNGQTLTSSTTVPSKTSDLAISDTIIYIDTTEMPRGPESQSLTLSWDNSDNSYYYVVVDNIDTNPRDIEYTSSGFWGTAPSGFTPPSNFRFMSQPFKTGTYTVGLMSSIKQFGKHRARVYKVNTEYADLYENRSQDSRNLTEPLTNVTNGLGIFTAFSYAEIYFWVVKE